MVFERLLGAKILIVDDEHSNTAMVEDILRATGFRQIWSTNTPCQTLSLIQATEPDLLLLDLHMPQVDGFHILEQLKGRAATQTEAPHLPLPILVLSGDSSIQTKTQALSAGAKDFLARPFDVAEFQLRVQNLLDDHFLHRQLREQNRELEECIVKRTQDLEQTQLEVKEAQLEIIERLALAGELRDHDTGEHTQRVSLVASLIAQNLGLPTESVELLRRAAPLHDVGKIGVADPILLKRESLTPEEHELIKEHCRIGARMLSGGNAELIQMAERIALSHHEHWDGSGYPQGLKGEQIPLEARILTVADVFDALTHARPYKNAWRVDDAITEIRAQSGKQFDPQVVDAFLQLPHESLI